MAAKCSEEEIDSLLSSFDQIYQDFKSVMTEIQSLRSNWNEEIRRRETLEITSNSLKQENERLTKLYMESLTNLAHQLERRTTCQTLKEELKRVRDDHLTNQQEHSKAMELLKHEYANKVADLDAQIRGFLLDKATNEATVNHLRQDLAAHKTHLQTLANRLDRVSFDLDSKYHLEIQDLKDCLLVEQEEKNELNKKLQDLEKELLIAKTKQIEQHQDLAPNRLVETLKTKIMKLRKENEILKRKLSNSQESGN